MTPRRWAGALGAVATLLTVAACATGPAHDSPRTPVATSTPIASAPVAALPAPTTGTVSPSSTPHPTTARSTTAGTPSPATRPPSSRTATPLPPPAAGAPVIVIDPGHSVTVGGTDPATGLNVADYENEPEMRDVYDVAQRVRAALSEAGYRVILTKKSLYAPTNLLTRAQVANAAHAALALSIHDQAGSKGGIGFDAGNNVVYYQSVGDYRVNPAGRKITFTDASVAALSKRYGQVFQRERAAVQHTSIRLQGDTGYDLGGRGLQGGDIWMVQLLSRVPWVYNEAGGNSAGMSGLSATDRQRYADGLVAAVEACVPLKR